MSTAQRRGRRTHLLTVLAAAVQYERSGVCSINSTFHGRALVRALRSGAECERPATPNVEDRFVYASAESADEVPSVSLSARERALLIEMATSSRSSSNRSA